MKKIEGDVTMIGLLEEYILEPRDVAVIKAALDYAHHRMTKHNKYFFANLKDIQRLRREFGIIKSE